MLRITRNRRIMRLPYGPDTYWTTQLARVGWSAVWATRIIGRWYWVEVIA